MLAPRARRLIAELTYGIGCSPSHRLAESTARGVSTEPPTARARWLIRPRAKSVLDTAYRTRRQLQPHVMSVPDSA
eukprot:2068499-Rhodomonas_salina.1